MPVPASSGRPPSCKGASSGKSDRYREKSEGVVCAHTQDVYRTARPVRSGPQLSTHARGQFGGREGRAERADGCKHTREQGHSPLRKGRRHLTESFTMKQKTQEMKSRNSLAGGAGASQGHGRVLPGGGTAPDCFHSLLGSRTSELRARTALCHPNRNQEAGEERTCAPPPPPCSVHLSPLTFMGLLPSKKRSQVVATRAHSLNLVALYLNRVLFSVRVSPFGRREGVLPRRRAYGRECCVRSLRCPF